MRTLRFLALAAAVASLAGQGPSHSGIHPDDMDTTCKPCTDFWRYANGGWIDENPIPPDKSSWGPFPVLADANRERLRTILDAAASAPAADARKMGDYYAACMDTAAIDKRGYQPLQADFDRIAAIRSREDLIRVLSDFQKIGRPSVSTSGGAVVGPFRITAGQDLKHPDRVVPRVAERDGPGSAILSLPDRDYYFAADERSKRIRSAFVDHAAKLLELAGSAHADAVAQAEGVMKFETELAGSVMTIPEKRDPDKVYHPMDLAGLRQIAPEVDWGLILHDEGVPEFATVIVTEPELLKKVNRMLIDQPIANWKQWLRWRDLQLSAPYLAKPFADESFHFQSTVLAGIPQAPPRWEKCADYVDGDLSDSLAKAYVAKYFPPEAKRRMLALVENLRGAMREELEQSEWMQPETKKKAIEKLNALQVQVGYPDRWRDYSAMKIDRAQFFENVRAAWAWGKQYQMDKIGKPVSKVDWSMTPPTVNAYSSATEIKVVFPAGILQPPFFDMNADDAANYGAIGAVIGHEIGHQFDDAGSKFDATGALNNWWTGEDRARFDARTKCVADQFDSIDVGGGLHHKGRQVLGEALGDLGGIATSYRAYHRSLGAKDGPVIDGFTADQRFFIAYARIWGTNVREEYMRLQVNTNPHPIARWRALATLGNMPEFHKAFGCKPGDAMVRPAAEQCRLW